MTASGQRRLRARLAELQTDAQKNAPEIAHLEAGLESATVVDVPKGSTDTVSFGTIVQVRHASGAYQSFHIVGVDELDGEEGAVSWISPIGKALHGREVGERVSLEDNGGKMAIEKIEYPAE
jgi:transcription elongation GreA/GreB family factor